MVEFTNFKKMHMLGYSELMKQPKPDICDYVMELRERKNIQADVADGDVLVIPNSIENDGFIRNFKRGEWNDTTEEPTEELIDDPQTDALDPVFDAAEIDRQQKAGSEPIVRKIGKKKRGRKKKSDK
jgi:hypothetical protein